MLALPFFLSLAVGAVAQAAQIRLVWDAPAGSPWVEVETASDTAYSKGTQIHRLALTRPLFETPKFPPFARVRSIRPDGKPMSVWQPLSLRSWAPPVIDEKVIEVSRSEAGKTIVTWDESEGFPLGGLTYRARIFDPSGNTLADQIVPVPKFLVPKLPGGNYELQIEVLGDARKGALHLEGTGVAAVVIQAEAQPFDPKQPTEVPLTFLALQDFYKPGALLRAGLSYKGNGFRRTSTVTLESRYASEGGFLLGASLPVTWFESDELEDPQREAPRLGGDPWPEVYVSHRLIGVPEHYLGLGLLFSPNTDTSDHLSLQGDQIRVLLPARVSYRDFSLDAAFTVGGAFGRDFDIRNDHVSVNSRFSGAASLALSYYWRDRWQFGASMTMLRAGRLQFEVNDVLTLTPQQTGNFYQPKIGAAYRLARTTYVEGTMERLNGGALVGSDYPFNTYRVVFTHVF